MKKLLLLFALVLTVCSTAMAEDGPAKNEIWYTSSDGNVVEPNYDDFGARIVSNTYKGDKGVIKFNNDISIIGEFAFSGCESLSSIAIPEGVTSIANYAFTGSGLNSITIPGSVTSIGISAFNGCNNLASVTLQDGVTSIGEYAFTGCKELVSVTLPSGLTSIANYAFTGSGLNSITIPGSVTSIGNSAFNDCKDLASVKLSESLKSIGEYAFAGSGLNSITIPGSVTSFGQRAFADCQFLTSVTLQDGVTSIGNFAFSDCKELASVKLPESLKSIGEYAFSACEKLTSVTLPEGLTIIRQCAFAGTGITDLVIPSTVISIGEYAFNNYDVYRSVYLLRLLPQDYHPKAFGSIKRTIYVPSVTREAYSCIYGNEIETIPWDTYKSHAITAINTEIMANAVKLTDKDVEDIQKFIDIIKNTESESEAEAALNEVIELIADSGDDYAWYKELFFGSLGIEQEGPAIEITAPDGKVIRLYNPKSVKYINK